MGSRRRLLCAFVILVWVGVFATLVMLIYAGWDRRTVQFGWSCPRV
jgi:hypothetical protein